MSTGRDLFPYIRAFSSSLAKKFVSATAVADRGTAQAHILAPSRRSGSSIGIGGYTIVQRTAAPTLIGIAGRLDTASWVAGTLTAAGAFTDDTADAQDADAGDMVLHDGASSGSGFLVGAALPFDVLSMVMSAAGDQVSPTLVLEYWNGTAWVDMVASVLHADALIAAGTGEKLLAWPLPPSWVPGGSGTNVPSSRYNLRVRHTNGGAGTINPALSQLFPGRSIILSAGWPQDVAFSEARSYTIRMPHQIDAVYPVFGSASALNYAIIDYRFEQ